jgi:hypothetical protein
VRHRRLLIEDAHRAKRSFWITAIEQDDRAAIAPLAGRLPNDPDRDRPAPLTCSIRAGRHDRVGAPKGA